MNVLKAQWKPSKEGRLLIGPYSYSGQLQLLLDEEPAWDEFVFRKYGPFLFASLDGFVRVYVHKPGTRAGFAGRTITLNVEGEKKDFHGSLWDPISLRDAPDDLPQFRSVSITADPKVMKRGYTFGAAYMLKSIFETLAQEAEVLDATKAD